MARQHKDQWRVGYIIYAVLFVFIIVVYAVTRYPGLYCLMVLCGAGGALLALLRGIDKMAKDTQQGQINAEIYQLPKPRVLMVDHELRERATDYATRERAIDDEPPVVDIPPLPTTCVYMLKAGPYYKIGKTSNFEQCLNESTRHSPLPIEVVHTIATDYTVTIDAYWHRRFQGKHIGDGWFVLTGADIAEFKRDKGSRTADNLPRQPAVYIEIPGVDEPPLPPRCIYMLKAGPYYKIGKARNLEQHLNEIKQHSPLPIEVVQVHTIATARITEVETSWHRHFNEKRTHDDWFELTDDDVAEFKWDHVPRQRNEAPVTHVSSPPPGCVYMLKAGPFYKIGKASNFERRLNQIKLQLPYSVEVVHTITTDRITEVETYWHRRFKEKRTNGEWFVLTDDDVVEFKQHSVM